MFSGDIEYDCMVLYNILEPLEYYIGTERRTKQFSDFKCKKKGGSVLYGYTWKGYLSPNKNRTKSIYEGLYNTKCKDVNPELEEIFKEFASIYFKNFKYI